MLEKVLGINKNQNATVYKASELLESVEPLLQYSYVAEEYDFELEGRCRRVLDQYDTTYKEVIGFRCKTEMDKVDTKTAECLRLLGKVYHCIHYTCMCLLMVLYKLGGMREQVSSEFL